MRDKVSFPFFDPDFLAAPGNDLPLWRRLVRPGDANLFFVGLFQAIGALMPIAEAQARLIGLPRRHLCVPVGLTDDGGNGAGARAALPQVRAIRTPHNGD
jgi:hypothetical protein